MPQVVVTKAAVQGLEICRQFLLENSPLAAQKAAVLIAERFRLLEHDPCLGRPFQQSSDLRELVIHFGGSGYMALYRYEPSVDVVYVLAFRHQKEEGYCLSKFNAP